MAGEGLGEGAAKAISASGRVGPPQSPSTTASSRSSNFDAPKGARVWSLSTPRPELPLESSLVRGLSLDIDACPRTSSRLRNIAENLEQQTVFGRDRRVWSLSTLGPYLDAEAGLEIGKTPALAILRGLIGLPGPPMWSLSTPESRADAGCLFTGTAWSVPTPSVESIDATRIRLDLSSGVCRRTQIEEV